MKSFKELETNKKILVIFLLCLIIFFFVFGFNEIKNTRLEYECMGEVKYFDNKEEVLAYHMTTDCFQGIDMDLNLN